MDDGAAPRMLRARCRLDADALRELARRLDGHRPPTELGSEWDRGVPAGWLDALPEDWRAFDTDALELRLDALHQLHVDLAGQALHLVLIEGRGPNPVPLLLTHGWPGSFLEYLPVLDLLSDPGAHGADPADAFTAIVPSPPGYGFSAPPRPTGLTGREVARLWHALMTKGLGYDRYFAHGSDLGAGVTAWLARDQPRSVAAVHLATPGLAPVPGPRTEQEEDFARAVQAWTAEALGYMPACHQAHHARRGPGRQSRWTGGVDRRENRGVEQHAPRRQPRI